MSIAEVFNTFFLLSLEIFGALCLAISSAVARSSGCLAAWLRRAAAAACIRTRHFAAYIVVEHSNQFPYHVPKCIKIKYVQVFKNTFSHDSIAFLRALASPLRCAVARVSPSRFAHLPMNKRKRMENYFMYSIATNKFILIVGHFCSIVVAACVRFI